MNVATVFWNAQIFVHFFCVSNHGKYALISYLMHAWSRFFLFNENYQSTNFTTPKKCSNFYIWIAWFNLSFGYNVYVCSFKNYIETHFLWKTSKFIEIAIHFVAQKRSHFIIYIQNPSWYSIRFCLVRSKVIKTGTYQW